MRLGLPPAYYCAEAALLIFRLFHASITFVKQLTCSKGLPWVRMPVPSDYNRF